MNKLKICIFLLIPFTSLFWLTSCEAAKPLKLGFVASLTGTTSEIGVTGRNGAILAIDEINSSGGIKGRKLELVVKDDKNNAQAAVAADKELVKEGVAAIIGHMTSGMGTLSIPFANDNNILMLSPTISADEFSEKDDNFLRIISSNRYHGEYLAEKAIDIKSCPHVAIVYDRSNVGYSEVIAGYFKRKFESLGGMIASMDSFNSGDTSKMADIAVKLSNTEVECIFIVASSIDSAILCQQLKKHNLNLKVFLPAWAMTQDLINHGGTAVEGAYLMNFIDLESDRQDYIKFRNTYFEEYNSEPTFASVYSYEAVKVLYQAMKKTGSYSASELKKAILEEKTFKGMQGDFVIDRFGDGKSPLYLYQIKERRFVKVE